MHTHTHEHAPTYIYIYSVGEVRITVILNENVKVT